jgi:hypothetical protein
VSKVIKFVGRVYFMDRMRDAVDIEANVVMATFEIFNGLSIAENERCG